MTIADKSTLCTLSQIVSQSLAMRLSARLIKHFNVSRNILNKKVQNIIREQHYKFLCVKNTSSVEFSKHVCT